MAKNKNSFSLKKPKGRRLPLWMWAVIVLVLLGGAVAAYFALGQSNSQMDSPETTTSEPINFDPPTATEQQDSEENKNRIVDEQEQSNQSPEQPQSPGSKKSVSPTITEASRSVVKAYVTGIFEEGGTCTATFTKGSQTLTKTSDGFGNVSYTQCAPMDLEDGFLSSGKWSVTVKYSSSVSEGTSAVQYIE